MMKSPWPLDLNFELVVDLCKAPLIACLELERRRERCYDMRAPWMWFGASRQHRETDGEWELVNALGKGVALGARGTWGGGKRCCENWKSLTRPLLALRFFCIMMASFAANDGLMAHIVFVVNPIQISGADPVGHHGDFEPFWRV
jgi:hypothetical protein